MDGKRESRNKNILIGALIAVVLIMGVGYAAFAQQLTITGNANVTSTWDVHIKSITPGKPVGTASNVSAEVTPGDTTKATFSTNLVSPGDSLTYTVTVENTGTIDAKVADDGVTFTWDESNPAIKYSYSGIDAGTKVGASSEATFTVTVTYDAGITSQPTPEQLSNTLTMKLNFVQDAAA